LQLFSLQSIRPFVVCAVLRGVQFTPERYQSFIDLQDKLHTNICRRRTLVAIGTHDLDTVKGPFRYEAKAPSEIEFVPLSQTKSYRADALMEFYRTDPSVKHIKPYVDIIASSPVYPVIYDANNTLLSLPPIINGDHSKISLKTKNVLIECTATDLAKAQVVLNTMVTMFSEYCAEPFTVESVDVVYEGPNAASANYSTPQLSYREVNVATTDITGVLGVPLSASATATLIQRMGLTAVVSADEHSIVATVPPTRSDILHPCDIVEDVAIAYGYNNIPRTLPRTLSVGMQLPVNKLTDLLRHELAHAGYNEALTLALCSRDENFSHMQLPETNDAVVLANPKTEEFQIGRTRLVPGLLKSLASNKATGIKDGIKIFEISDVMFLDSTTDVGSRNERHLATAYTGATAGFEVTHSLVDRVMQLLEVPVRPYTWDKTADANRYGKTGWRYTLEPTDAIATYFPGRGAHVVLENAEGKRVVIGSLGVLHPKVLKAFELNYPASVLEINIELFV
jgi:phenylalanyl-tRNA synthetase beta chain